MRLNSLHDPDYTGVGHQPYGYDQVTAIYQKYKVYSVTIEVMFWQQSAALLCGLQCQGPDDVSVLAGLSPDVVAERPIAEVYPLSGVYDRQVRFRKTIKIKDLIGMTEQQFNSDIDGTTAQVGNNPARPCYLRLAVADPTGGVAQGGTTCQVAVRLTYHSRLWSRHTQAQS
jgi:hypothetical protein